MSAGNLHGFTQAVGVVDGSAVCAGVIADRGFIYTYARTRIFNAFGAFGTLAAIRR